jgi:hypothetical protein
MLASPHLVFSLFNFRGAMKAKILVCALPALILATFHLEEAQLAEKDRVGVDYSALGGTRCGRFREGIRVAEQAAPGRTLRTLGRADGC